MFISRFNRFFEKHGRWIYFILGLIISLSFVVFVTPGRFLGNAQSAQFKDVGQMYGKKIDRADFVRKMQQTDIASFLTGRGFLSQNQRMGGDRLVQETLKRIRAIREAEKLGLGAVSKAELLQSVRDMWMFQENGKFQRERFSNFKQNVLAQRGLTGDDFDEILRQNIMIDRLEAQVAADVFVSDAEVKDLYNQQSEKFVVQFAEFDAAGITGPDGDPADSEITAYFDKNRETMRLPDLKKALVIVVDSQAYMGAVEVSDAEISARYEKLKKTAYKGKTLDDVKGQIKVSLQNTKATEKAKAVAAEFHATVSKRPEGETGEQLLTRFRDEAAKGNLEVIEAGPFAEEGEISGLGKVPAFQRQAYALTAENPVSGVIYGPGKYYVACWLETILGDVPTELNEMVRKQIIEKITEADARTLYQEKVVDQFGEALKKVSNAWDLTTEYETVLAGMTDKSQDEKQRLRTEYRTDVRNYAVPYFVPDQKKARVAVFSPAAYRAKITIQDDEVAQYYDEHDEEYAKEEVRLRQIVVKFEADATPEEKAGKRAKIDAVLQRLRTGEPFDAVAKAESEDDASKANGGDIGFKEKGALTAKLDAAAFELELGEISDVIETPTAFVVLKLEQRRSGKPLAEVAGQIRKTLMDEEASRQAMDAAYDFADAVFTAVERSDTEKVPGDLFSQIAVQKGVQIKDTGLFREGGTISPFGFDRELSQAAFQTSQENPFSDPVKGKTDVYVVCWLETQAAYLPNFDDDKSLLQRVANRVRRERAIAKARKRAQDAWETMSSALAGGKPFAEAAGGLTFEKTDPFTRSQLPPKLRNSADVVSMLIGTEPGSLLDVAETDNGALIVFLESRALPGDEEFEKEGSRYRMQLQWTKRQAVLDAFYKRLEDESETVLSAAWSGAKES